MATGNNNPRTPNSNEPGQDLNSHESIEKACNIDLERDQQPRSQLEANRKLLSDNDTRPRLGDEYK